MLLDPERFQSRHIGPDSAETVAMLKEIGAASMDALIAEAIPGMGAFPVWILVVTSIAIYDGIKKPIRA